MKDNTATMQTATISENEFLRLRSRYPDLRLELIQGEVFAMPPVGGDSGRLEGAYAGELYLWSKTHPGEVYSASTGFRLPNGNIRSADASIFLPGNPAYGRRWTGFLRGVPDFLIEIRSSSDDMPRLRAKMTDWIRSGCRLAWLVDPVGRRVLEYKPSGYEVPRIRRHAYDARIETEDLLPGFALCPAELDGGRPL